jgi:hypothetical protein
MGEWQLKEAGLKKYPHFDSLISAKDAETLALDPQKVERHTFYPFLLYTKHWTRFAENGEKGQPKDRPIRYAARRDAYIYARYRHLLAELYEAELSRLGLGNCVLAYRRILKSEDGGGKCNIDFARDAFLKVREMGNCCVVALDISSYFEHLDHARLKSLWCRLLGKDRLPLDHFQVFKAITRYAVVEKDDVYERLGHIGVKGKSASGKPIKGYLTPFRDIPKQLCRGNDFRTKIAGGPGKSLVKVNYKPYGIPQGGPISDLLANLYLLDFDQTVNALVSAVGGAYYRYSDDILIITPGDATTGMRWLADMKALIREHGEMLEIKDKKSAVFVYSGGGNDQIFTRVYGEQGGNGLEYLGFRYDGRKVYLRDSTISGLRRKVVSAARRESIMCANQFPTEGVADLKAKFDYERLVKRFGKVEDFAEKQDDCRQWTFWTYARRASEIFGPLGKPILEQLKRHAALVRERSNQELERAVVRRDKRAAQADDNSSI